MAGIPFKACILGGTGGADVVAQVGVVAKNYQNFRELLQVKYGLENDFQVFLDDGTQVCDEEYFEVLEPQTKLTVVQRGANRPRVGEKRPLVIAPADSATSLHQSKQGRLMSPTQEAISALTATAATHDSLISCLRIASVTGNVNMAASPTRTATPTQSVIRGSISPPQQTQSPPLRSRQSPPFQQPQQIHIQNVGPTPHSAPPLTHLPTTLAQELSAAQARQYHQLLQQQQLRQQQQLHHQQQQRLFHHQQQQLQQLHYAKTQVQASVTSPPGVVTSPPNVYVPSVHPQQSQHRVTYQPVQRTPSHRGIPATPQAPYVFPHQDSQSHHLQAHPPSRPQHQMVIVSPPPTQPQLVVRQPPSSAPHQLPPAHHVPSLRSACQQQERQPLPPPLLAMTMAAVQRRNSAPCAVSMSQQPRAGRLQSSVSPIVKAVHPIAQPERLTHRLSPQPNLFHPTTQAAPKQPPQPPQQPAHSVRQPVTPQQPTSKVFVVNCKDVISPSSVEDTDDEGSLHIIERSSSTCSTPSTPPPPQKETSAFSFEVSKSRSTPPIPPSQLATCAHTALKDQAVKVTLQDNAQSETSSNNDDMNIESPLDIETDDLSSRRFSAASPDDGYASSTSFGSANDITSKLPFADFESSIKSFAATLLPGLEPGEHTGVREEKEHLTEAAGKAACVAKSTSEERVQDDKESPSLFKTQTPEDHEQQSTKEENEPSLVVEEKPEETGTVDTRLYHTLMQDSKEILVIDADDVSDSLPPPPTPSTPSLALVMSIPIHCNEEGEIVCRGLEEALQTASSGDATHESKVDGDETQVESCDELVVSIPMRHLASGVICRAVRDKENEIDRLSLESGLAKLNSNKEKAIQVQEYASEELVVTSASRLRSSSGCFRVRSKRSRSRRSRVQSKRPRSGCSLVQSKKPGFCTQADITNAVKEIIADLKSADCEQTDIKGSVAEEQVLVVGEQMELAVDGGSEDGEEILLVSSDFGNEVVVSEEQDDDGESEVELIMSSLENAPPQRAQEEIETEVVQMECLADEHHSEQSVCSVYTAPEEISITKDQDQQPDGTEVQELSQKIEGLLELADLLSPLESKTIKDFFNGKHSDPPTRGLQTYCLKKLSDIQAVFLEINFETRKWRGFVSHSP